MGGYIMLDQAMKDILRVVEPSQNDWEVRNRIITELQSVVQSIESLQGATIEPFGSFVSNLYSRWGDLDLSIQLNNGSCIPTSGKKLKGVLLKDVRKALRRKGGWSKLQLISNARVPIVKMENFRHKISCDISIDNLVGQMKSRILLRLNEIDGRFRDMVLLVKEWAKAHDINNSKQGTFNSYTLSLLVIFHFQTCSPAIFPPLRDIYPGNIVDNLKGVRAEVEREIAETCTANIARFKMRTDNRSSLSELFVSFLAKFSDLSSLASKPVICPYIGQWMEIQSNIRWLTKKYTIFVEDPFEQPENSARGIHENQLTKIAEAFRMTHFRLTSAYQNSNSILDDLARPEILKLITKSSLSASAPESNMGKPTGSPSQRYAPPPAGSPIQSYAPRLQVHQARVIHPCSQVQYPSIRPQVHQARDMHPRLQVHQSRAMHPRSQVHQARAMHPRSQVHQARVMHPRSQVQQQFQDNAPRFNVTNFPLINPQAPHSVTTQSRPLVRQNPPNTRRLSNPNSLNMGEPSNPSKTYYGQGQQSLKPRSQR